jgi:hypothetical protein
MGMKLHMSNETVDIEAEAPVVGSAKAYNALPLTVNFDQR